MHDQIKNILVINIFIFKKFKLNRVEIDCAVDNIASRKVILKLGAKKEGRLRQSLYFRNKYHDEYMHSILKKEWKNNVKYKVVK